MGKVSLDNCREMHRRYEKNFMEKAGRNIRKSSCLRNNTDQNQTKKRSQIHAIFLHMEQMSGIHKAILEYTKMAYLCGFCTLNTPRKIWFFEKS